MIETFITVALILVTAGIWYKKHSKEKAEIKEYKQFAIKHPEIIDADFKVYNSIYKIQKDVPPCEKCNNPYLQLWNQSNDVFHYRCSHCKNIYLLNDWTTPNKIYDLKENVYNLYLLMGKIEEHGKKFGWSKLKEKLRFNYLDLIKGFPYIRAIKFEGLAHSVFIEQVSDAKPSRRISQEVKDKVWRRDEGKCVECGNNEKLEFDHIIPHSKGGSNTYRNIQLLCEPCNRQKSAALG